jgi:hypothetical protein
MAIITSSIFGYLWLQAMGKGKMAARRQYSTTEYSTKV